MSDQGKRVAAAAVVAAGAALGLAQNAGAQTVAASLQVDKACYITVGRTRPTMVVTGSGFPAGDSVDISDSTGTFSAQVTANAAGQITATGPAPIEFFSKPGEKRDTITATDYYSIANGNTYTASATTLISELDASAQSRRGRGLSALTRKTKWSFSGFPEGREIWGHYLYRGKTVARQKFGRAHGPCGLLTARKPLYPARPHHRAYRIQLDASRHYSTHTRPRLVSKVSLQLF